MAMREEGRTVSDAERGTGSGEVILQVIIQKAKDGDEEVEEDPDGEKEALATFVDHPEVPFLLECFGLVGSYGLGGGCVGALEALEAPALRFVALEVCGLGSISVVIQVWMRVERGLRAVGKVEPTSGHCYELLLVGGMNRIRDGWSVDLRKGQRKRMMMRGGRTGLMKENEEKKKSEEQQRRLIDVVEAAAQ